MPLAPDSFNSRILRRAWARYAVASLATGTALLARWGLNPWLGDRLPFITLFPVIAFSALYCGIGPSVVTTVLAVAATKYWFIPPTHSFGQISPTQALDMIVFLLAFGLIIVVAEAHRGSAETLRRAQEELEDRVRQRTIELDTANRNLRDLTARLLQLQDEERRRFARELHDSVGQTLVALNMNLATVAAEIERLSKTGSVIKDSAALVEDLTKEVRTMSHLLHPPLLDEAGLNSALRWYIDGLVERSHIKVDLEYSQDLGRLSRELETAIFRTVQECLTNIHRHSQSPTAKVRILRRGGVVRVEVEDKGKGIPPEKQEQLALAGSPGVGIRGMRERVRQLGGSLDINSNGQGTVVVAELPVADTASTATTAAA